MPNPESLLKGEPQREVTRGGRKPLGTTGSWLQQRQPLAGTAVPPLPCQHKCLGGRAVNGPGSNVRLDLGKAFVLGSEQCLPFGELWIIVWIDGLRPVV